MSYTPYMKNKTELTLGTFILVFLAATTQFPTISVAKPTRQPAVVSPGISRSPASSTAHKALHETHSERQGIMAEIQEAINQGCDLPAQEVIRNGIKDTDTLLNMSDRADYASMIDCALDQ